MAAKTRRDQRLDEPAELIAAVKDFFNRRGNHILVGICVLLIGYLAYHFAVGRPRAQRLRGWYELQKAGHNAAVQFGKPGSESSYQQIVQDSGDDLIRAWALLGEGFTLLRQVNCGPEPLGAEQAGRLLQRAEDAFKQAVDLAGKDVPLIRAQAQMGLAAVAAER